MSSAWILVVMACFGKYTSCYPEYQRFETSTECALAMTSKSYERNTQAFCIDSRYIIVPE